MAGEASNDTTETIIREVIGVVRGLKDLHRHVGVPEDDGGELLEAPSFVILLRLAEFGPIRVSALADALLVDVSTASRQLHALEESGWVARERDPADARAQLMHLTPAGARVLDRNRRLRGDALRQVLADWPEADRRRLAEALTRLNRALQARRGSTGTDADAGDGGG